MRVATYNLRFGGLAGLRTHWTALAEVHDPDLILLQECAAPEEYVGFSEDGPTVIWRPVDGRTWGSAIVTRFPVLRELIVPGFDGWVVGAELQVGGGTVQAFSVHVPSGRGSYVKILHVLLDVISTAGFNPSVIGGDFNIGVGVRVDGEVLRTTSAEKKVMGRLASEFRLHPAWQTLNPESPLTQTLRWSGNQNAPYHCDGFFVPADWLNGSASCEVLTDDRWRQLSDHYPVTAIFTPMPTVPMIAPGG